MLNEFHKESAGYFIYFIALCSLENCGEFVTESHDSELCRSQVQRSTFYQKQNIQSWMDCPLEIHKALFVFVFCTNRIIENFLEKKTTDLSVIQPQSSTQVKEDVLGLLGIEGGLFGLVGRWLVFFFVVSRCGVFLPGRIHRFNDDQCVLS